MKITSVSYRAHINLGNYESEEIELTAELGERDTPEEALNELRERIDGMTFQHSWLAKNETRQAARPAPQRL